MAILVLLCVPCHFLSLAVTGRSHWPQRFLGAAGRAIGIKATAIGQPVRDDAFFIANHVSWADILVLGGATGCAFVAKDDVARWPVIGWLASLNNTVMVARTRRGAVKDQVDALRAAVSGHQPVTLFAEGTTGDGRTLLPFKPALFAVLLPPPRPILIQPVVIDYGSFHPHMGWADPETAGEYSRRILGRDGTITAQLHFLEPIDPGDHPDRKAIAAECRVRILAKMQALRLEPTAV